MTIKAFATDDLEMEKYPDALLHAPVARELEFREGLQSADPRGQDGFGTKNLHGNFLALLIFVSGVVPNASCKKKCETKFAYCVIPRTDIDYDGKLTHCKHKHFLLVVQTVLELTTSSVLSACLRQLHLQQLGNPLLVPAASRPLSLLTAVGPPLWSRSLSTQARPGLGPQLNGAAA